MTDNAALAGELGRSRLQLLDALALVPDDAWQPRDWGVREMVAHLAARDDICTRTVTELMDGGELVPVLRDGDAFNRQAIEDARELSPLQVVLRLHAARARLVSQVARAGDLGEFQFPWGQHGQLADMVRGLAEHEGEHSREILNLVRPTKEITL